MSHEHKLILIREFTGQHNVYWCRECGMIMEKFVERFAELLPEWSMDRLLKEDRKQEKYKFLHVKPEIMRKQSLGRRLKDIVSLESKKLRDFLDQEK